MIVSKPNQIAAAALLSLVCSLASATTYSNPLTTFSCCLGTAPYGVSNPTQAFSFAISGWNDGLPGALRYKDSNGVDPLTLSTPWNILSANPTLSMAYSATIEASLVAEPSSYAMAFAGMGVLTAFAQRRKQGLRRTPR